MEIVTQNYIGAKLKNIGIADFISCGIPLPVYAKCDGLLLLFEQEENYKAYLNKLKLIQSALKESDPAQDKECIQKSIRFISLILFKLNCN